MFKLSKDSHSQGQQIVKYDKSHEKASKVQKNAKTRRKTAFLAFSLQV